MREELKVLLLALAYECSQNKRTLYDMVMSNCPPKPPCPPPKPPPCPPEPQPCPPGPQPCPPGPCEDICKAAAQLMGSIALEEAALAHIMNAEGEKIQAAIANTSDVDKMLEVNASVADILKNVNSLEQTLLAKLQLLVDLVRCEKNS
ncbi:MAG: hypothetical protein LBB75_06795 [Oscillospiraceae bacterium]|jgi:hypothetical protein|nr:hypothetical protein [Oscillospiraceae bacterium]